MVVIDLSRLGTPTKEIHFADDGFAMGVAYILAILKVCVS